MKTFLKLMPIILVLFILAAPASASASTTIEFTQPANTVISNISAEFTGKITAPQKPVNPFYSYVVYEDNTRNVLDGSNRVTVNNTWTYNDKTGLYESDFSFTTKLTNYTGPARVRLEMSEKSRVFSAEVKVYAQPVKFTFREKDNLVIAGNSYTFTVYAESEVRVYPTYSFEVLNAANRVIDYGTVSNESNWSVDSNTGLYKKTLQFTAGFGSYTGPAEVVIQATDDRTYSTELSVQVGKETVTKQQSTEFKNYGQLVSYLAQRLQFYGYGPHKNHGQAMKACLTDPDFRNYTTHAEVDRYLNRHFGSSTGKGKK